MMETSASKVWVLSGMTMNNMKFHPLLIAQKSSLAKVQVHGTAAPMKITLRNSSAQKVKRHKPGLKRYLKHQLKDRFKD